jgi:hypothetical protein
MDNYKNRSVELFISEIRVQTSTTIPTKLDKLRAELDVIDDDTGGIDNDLHFFINDRPIRNTSTPLEWWCTTAQIKRYPRLSRMAIDILSIPPMSDKTERVFSGARRSITWGRARLGPETIEAVECVSHWLTDSLIRSMLSSTASTDGESTIESMVLDSIENEGDDNSDSY